MPFIDTAMQTLVFILISPAVVGTLHWLKARLQGQQGPSFFLPYWNLRKLFRRQAVVPETASWVFSAAPFVVFGCYVIVGLLTPIIHLPSTEYLNWLDGPLANRIDGPPFADLLVIIYLIGLARFAIGLAGMDTGSPLTGLGSAREMFMHVMAEPVLVMVAYVLALASYSTSLSGALSEQPALNPPLFLLALLALALVLLLESGRIPFDHTDSTLELTMIGKAVQLEYGGPHLALLQWAEAMQLTFFITLFANLAFPGLLAVTVQPDWLIHPLLLLVYPLKLFVLVVILAVWELTRARLRLRGATGLGELALTYAVLAVFAAVVVRYFF